MKLNPALAIAAACVPMAAAQAQPTSSVQLYGQLTAAVTARNNQAGGATARDVGNSVLAASLVGVRGTEDLGGGMAAVFRLESAIASDTGAAGATVAGNARLWNRQSFVGLTLNPMATLTFGRQFHAATDRVIQTLDVYNVAGTTLAVTPHALFGVNKFAGNDSRADDSVKLRLRGPGGLTGAVSAGLDDGAGRSWSIDVARLTPQLNLGAYVVQFDSPTIAANGTRPSHTAWGFGGNLPLGKLTAYLHLMDARLDPSAVGRVETRNRILHLGAAWRAAPQTVLKLAWYHDRGRNLNGVAGRDGNKDTAVASGEYALSRRTSLYAAAFSNRFTDGYRLDPVNIAALGRDPAASSTSGLSLGVRHDF